MIKIHNDGKEKSQSWQASLEIRATSSLGGFASADLTCYGDTEDEAVEGLVAISGSLVEEISRIDYATRIAVAWDGTPVDEYLKREGLRR